MLRVATLLACLWMLALSAIGALSQLFRTHRGLHLADLLGFLSAPAAFFLALLVAGWLWERHRWRALLPPAVLLLGIVPALFAARAGGAAREHWFRQQLPAIERLVLTHAPRTPGTHDTLPRAVLPPAGRATCGRLFIWRDSTHQIGARCLMTRNLDYVYGADALPRPVSPTVDDPWVSEPFAPSWRRRWR